MHTRIPVATGETFATTKACLRFSKIIPEIIETFSQSHARSSWRLGVA
jgi:hypothetical protein